MDSNNSVWNLLNELSAKRGITEIIINNVDNIYIERAGEMIRLNAKLQPDHIMQFCLDIAKVNKKKFDKEHQIVDGNLPDGSRINIIGPEYTQGSPAITIRKYLKNFTDLDHGGPAFNLSPKVTSFIKAMVESKSNILVSGATGCGKTTVLSMMLQQVSPTERLVIIEDTRELSVKLPNVVRLLAKTKIAASDDEGVLSTQDLVKNALRMRPDRIIIGEVRGGEAFDLLQAMNTGHDGSMCTIHANGAGDCISKLETLFMLAGHDVPTKAIRKQICSALDFIIQLKKSRDGSRVISSITEISTMEGENITTQKIVDFTEDKGVHFTGLVPARVQKLMEHGLDTDFFIDT